MSGQSERMAGRLRGIRRRRRKRNLFASEVLAAKMELVRRTARNGR